MVVQLLFMTRQLQPMVHGRSKAQEEQIELRVQCGKKTSVRTAGRIEPAGPGEAESMDRLQGGGSVKQSSLVVSSS